MMIPSGLELSNFLSDHPVGFPSNANIEKSQRYWQLGRSWEIFLARGQPSLNKRAGTKDSLTFVPARFNNPPINEQILLW